MKKTFLAISILAIILTGCSSPVNTETSSSDTSQDSTQDSVSETITFGSTTTTDGQSQIDGNNATISTGGTYKITGSSDDANLTINAPEEDVNLILEDLTLTSENTAAIIGIDANSLNITLNGTNNLSDTENNTDDYQAPIFIDEIETHINGDGTLNLTGNYQEGFESNNDLYIESGNYNINSQDDGINAGDLLSISGGNINVDSNGDGLDSNGDLEISGGTTYASAGNNGNGPIDYGDGGTFKLTGGTVLAVGGNMGVTPTENEQEFLTASTAGTTITAGDLTYDAPKEFSFAFITFDGITADTTVKVDGSEVETSQEALSGMGGGGGMGNRPAMDGNFDPTQMAQN